MLSEICLFFCNLSLYKAFFFSHIGPPKTCFVQAENEVEYFRNTKFPHFWNDGANMVTDRISHFYLAGSFFIRQLPALSHKAVTPVDPISVSYKAVPAVSYEEVPAVSYKEVPAVDRHI